MVEIFDLIYAWAVAELGLSRAWTITWPYLERLSQTSPETAAWGALKQVGLPKHAAHLKALVRTVETIPGDLTFHLDLRATRKVLRP
jgi:hypothetical protein